MDKSAKKRVVIIGGGAAGYFAAIACAADNPLVEVLLLEATQRPLTKVRISGGGRCNVTHHCFDVAKLTTNYPRGGKELRGPFSRFQPKDTIAWFAARGVATKVEADGRMFPVTDRSETIIECLQQAAAAAGVEVRLGAMVKSIVAPTADQSVPRFRINLREEKYELADAVLLATGSSVPVFAIVASLGHTIVPPCPSLFTFNIVDPRLVDLPGISVPQAALKLVCPDGTTLQQQGPLLITHWGLSGPAVLKLSAWGARPLAQANYQASLTINWLPEYHFDALLAALGHSKEQHGRKQIGNHHDLGFPKRLWVRLVETAGIESSCSWADVSKKDLAKLAQEITQGKFAVNGKGVFKEEFVTCGGVALKEVDFRTMQSRICPGLYFAGEILDVDGITGGFNFQNAWTTGWIAGQHMRLGTVRCLTPIS